MHHWGRSSSGGGESSSTSIRTAGGYPDAGNNDIEGKQGLKAEEGEEEYMEGKGVLDQFGVFGEGNTDGGESPGAARTLRQMLTSRHGLGVVADLADSWFGIGANEEQAVGGPSFLERRLEEDDSLSVPSLMLWDPSQLDLGLPSAQSQRPPFVSSATNSEWRRDGSSRRSNGDVADDPTDSYEMDHLIAAAPSLRPNSSGGPSDTAASAHPTTATQPRYQSSFGGVEDGEHQHQMLDFWSGHPNDEPGGGAWAESAVVGGRPQARGRGKGAPMKRQYDDDRRRGSSAAASVPQRKRGPGPGTLRSIVAVAPNAASASLQRISPLILTFPIASHHRHCNHCIYQWSLPESCLHTNTENKKNLIAKTGTRYWPVMILLVMGIDIGVFVAEIVYNGGLENFQVNPFVRFHQACCCCCCCSLLIAHCFDVSSNQLAVWPFHLHPRNHGGHVDAGHPGR